VYPFGSRKTHVSLQLHIRVMVQWVEDLCCQGTDWLFQSSKKFGLETGLLLGQKFSNGLTGRDLLAVTLFG